MIKEGELIEWFNSLPIEKKESVLHQLSMLWNGDEGDLKVLLKELDEQEVNTPKCKHCSSEETVRRGKFKGVQRYSCKICKKYWMATHGTSLAGLRKRELWNKYIEVFDKSKSLRAAAKEVGVCLQTSFRWRQRIMASLSVMAPQEMGGTIEMDEFQLSESNKGNRNLNRKAHRRGRDSKNHDAKKISVLVSVSRGNQGAMCQVIAAKKISSEQVNKAVGNKIKPGSTVITDKGTGFRILNQKEEISHKTVDSDLNRRRKDPVHLQTVNQAHKSIRDFLAKFNGVSTKYLQNYLNWYHYEQTNKMRLDRLKNLFIQCLTTTNALDWLRRLMIEDTIIIT